MLNSLSLLIIMILTLFLAFYCVDSHKENILTLVNTDTNSIEPAVNVEENLSKEAIKIVKPSEKVYVEVLAEEEANESQIVNNEPQTVVEKVAPVVTKTKEELPVKFIEEDKVTEEARTTDKKISEYSEGYQLDDLEKMIKEELKKGKKD